MGRYCIVALSDIQWAKIQLLFKASEFNCGGTLFLWVSAPLSLVLCLSVFVYNMLVKVVPFGNAMFFAAATELGCWDLLGWYNNLAV